MRLLGVLRSVLLGRSDQDEGWGFFSPEGVPLKGAENPFARAREEARTITTAEVRMHLPDGNMHALLVKAAPLFAAQHHREGVVAVITDYSAGTRAREALGATEATFRTVFNSVYDAIFLHERNGRIIDVNDRMLAMYGVTREEARSMTIVDDFSGQGNPVGELPQIWEQVLADHPQFFQWKARRPHSGETFDVEVYLRKYMAR